MKNPLAAGKKFRFKGWLKGKAQSMSSVIFLDFEFNQVVEPSVNLVCCATFDKDSGLKKRWWLHRSRNIQRKLYDYLKKFDIVIGYSCVAEARSVMALGLNPLSFKWIDLFLEYRMITNHNDRLQWGNQLVDGKVRHVRKPKPKWERTEEDKASGFKATHSLAEATYKLTGSIRDTAHKNKMRDLIISNPERFTEEERKSIMDYCMDDVVFLPTIWKRIKEEFAKLEFNPNMQQYFKEALERGRYSAHTALMESHGYPIEVEKTRNFSKQIPNIMYDLQNDINRQFPDSKPFRWNKNEGRFSWNQKVTKEWIEENHDVKRWNKTDGGGISLALDAFEKFYPFKHSYPEGNFGAQMVRSLKLKQNLYGFSESGGNRKNFWDSVGSDGMVRPYMNHFGAQSSRSQPAASGFMFLKPAWMRALVQPPPGYFMAGIDYGQQEFFIAALESGDQNMIAAYLSGDPYLFGAKLAGAIPQNGTKDSHKKERDLFKNTYLGILYGMTKYGLAIKLTNDTGRLYTEDEAQEQIDIFEDTFPDYMLWKKEIGDAYIDGGGIILPDGWRMYGDNDNIRSVWNVPVQGFGACVMRKAVDMAVEKSVTVLFTLHDAIYMYGKCEEEHKIAWLRDAMREGFQYYFQKNLKKTSGEIKLDPFAWSPDYEKDSELDIDGWKVPASNIYLDDRSLDEYHMFSKYFESPVSDLL